jgi:predicted N-acetyltransferase YhbS
VRTALAKAITLRYSSIIVLGHTQYYTRVGFKPASLWQIRSPFPAPEEAFMAMELTDGSLKDAAGVVEYASPFYEIE